MSDEDTLSNNALPSPEEVLRSISDDGSSRYEQEYIQDFERTSVLREMEYAFYVNGQPPF